MYRMQFRSSKIVGGSGYREIQLVQFGPFPYRTNVDIHSSLTCVKRCLCCVANERCELPEQDWHTTCALSSASCMCAWYVQPVKQCIDMAGRAGENTLKTPDKGSGSGSASDRSPSPFLSIATADLTQRYGATSPSEDALCVLRAACAAHISGLN